jgi:hypothetical protein
MDNILVESIRNSQEMSYNGQDSFAGDLAENVLKGRKNPMLARSFEMGVKHVNPVYAVTEPPENVKFNMDLTYKQQKTFNDMNGGFHGEIEDALKNSMTVEQTFGDKPTDMFYQPIISKPIRSARDVTIKLNKNGKLEGMPTAWREALDMDP